ncbi:MAG TPA: TfuA-like protein [Stellaceae bacterium]|nr:TfuA-like protein [Stellaceae bacterium]
MRMIVFAGPSLKASDRCVPSIEFHGPARCGEMARIAGADVGAIGLVDGAFESTASPWHKEILWLLSRNVAVFGAASLGALRAVELARFGMVGIGRVFAAYRDQVLEDDDEVAVLHGPEGVGYIALTEALVNIRATAERARAAKILDDAAAGAVTAAAKALFYKDRVWSRVLQQARARGLEARAAASLASWLPGNAVDVKRQDARALIQAMLAWRGDERAVPSFEFVNTIYWERLRRQLIPFS